MRRTILTIATTIFSLILLYSQPDNLNIEPASHIGGRTTCAFVDGQFGYLGQGVYLTILDVSSPEFNQLAYQVLPGQANDIEIVDDYAYITTNGLTIVDISSPQNPVITGNFEIDGDGEFQISVVEDHAYIAARENGLYIIDISTPGNPVQAGRFNNGNIIGDVFLKGDRAYVLDQTFNKLRVLNISNPANINETNEINIPGPVSITGSGDYLYIASDSWPDIGMQIVEISNPNNPVIRGNFETKTVNGNVIHYSSPRKITVDNNMAYIGCNTESSIFSVDISNPANPTEVNFYQTEAAWGAMRSIQKINDDIYIALGFDPEGLRKIDFSDPANPNRTGKHAAPSDVLWVQTDTMYLYVSSNSGIWIYNMTDPGLPQFVSRHDQWDPMFRIFKSDQLLFGLDHEKMVILDISDPNNVTELGRYTSATGRPLEVYAHDQLVYLIIEGNPGTLEIIDISDPANPAKIGESAIAGVGRDMYVDENDMEVHLVYWNSDTNRGYQVFDVSNPAGPFELTNMQTTGLPMAILEYEDTLFVGSISGQRPNMTWNLEAYEFTDPTSPVKLTELNGDGELWDLDMENGVIAASITGGSVYLIGWDYQAGYLIIYAICPSQYSRQGSTTTGGNGYGYVATVDGYGGYNYYGEIDITGHYGIVIQYLIIPPPNILCCLRPVVRPIVAAQPPFACSTTPVCVTGNCGSQAEVIAKEDADWVFTHWSGKAQGTKATTTASISGKLKCPPCGDGLALAHFAPWLEIQGAGAMDLCPVESEEEVTALTFNLKASKADDWNVTSVSVEISGDDELSQYIKEAKLKWTKEETKQHSGSGTVMFNTSGLQIKKGESQEFTFYLKFNKMTDLECPSEPKEITVSVTPTLVDAKAIQYPDGVIKPAKSATAKLEVGCIRNLDKSGDNVYETIQKAVDDAEDGNRIEVCPGEYEENVMVNKNDLKIFSKEGASKTFVKAKESNKPVFQLKSNGIQIKDFTIIDANQNAGIYVFGSTIENSKLEGNKLKNNKYGIYLKDDKKTVVDKCEASSNTDAGLYAENSNEITVKASKFYENQKYGIHLKDDKKSIIENSEANSNSEHGLFVQKSEDLSVKNSFFFENKMHGVNLDEDKKSSFDNSGAHDNKESGLYAVKSTDALIKSSTFYKNKKKGVYLNECTSTTVDDTRSYDNEEMGLYAINTKKDTLKGSSFYENKMDGVKFENCEENTADVSIITDCSFRENKLNGVHLLSCKGQLINDNIAFTENDSSGVLVAMSENIKIINNKTINGNGNGVKINNSKGIEINDNQMEENLENGIYILDCSLSESDPKISIMSNEVVGNRLSGRQKHGIYLRNSSNIKIGAVDKINQVRSHLQNGIYIIGGSQNEIKGSDIRSNNKSGIYFKNSCDNVIIGKANTIGPENLTGITLDGCHCDVPDGNRIFEAEVKENKEDGIYLLGSYGNRIGTAALGNTIKANKENGIYLLACECPQEDVNSIGNNMILENKKHGIFAEQSKFNYIHSNNISSNQGDGIHLRLDCFLNDIETNIIEGNEIQTNGIYLDGVSSNLVEENTISKHLNNGIYLKDASSTVSIIKNKLKENVNGIYCESSYGFSIGNYDGLEGGNTIESNSQAGIHLKDCESTFNDDVTFNKIKKNKTGIVVEGSLGIQLRKNEITSKHETGMLLESNDANFTKPILIEDNLVQNCLGHGILMKSSNGVVVGGASFSQTNDIKNNQGDGIRLEKCMSNGGKQIVNRFSKNALKNNNHGFNLQSSEYNEIVDNIIIENKKDGIHLTSSKSNDIYANRVHKNKMNGIKLKQSDNNNIGANDVKANIESGLHLDRSNSNQIPPISKNSANNFIENGDHGIRLDDSNKNELRANELMQNKKHGLVINEGQKNQFKGPSNIIDNGKDGIQLSKTYFNKIGGRTIFIGTRPVANIIIKGNDSQGVHLKNAHANIFGTMRILKHTTGLLLENSNKNSFNMGVSIQLNHLGGHGICSYNSNYGACAYGFNTIQTRITGCSVVPSTYEGTQFLDSEESAVVVNNGAQPTFRDCNFINCGDYAINNLNDTIQIDARFNWWGDPSGPGGMGPGIGSAVSENVIFEPWLMQAVSMQTEIIEDTLYIPVGASDSVLYSIRNLINPGDSILIVIEDELQWSGLQNEFSTSLPDSIGMDSVLIINIDPNLQENLINKIRVEATSLINPDQTDFDSVEVLTYIPVISRIELLPDTIILNTGEQWRYSPVAYDQFENEIEADFIWTTTGGTIDNAGLYTAQEPGVFTVNIEDIDLIASGSATVIVGEIPVLQGITITPTEVWVPIDSSLQFSHSGIDQYGEEMFFIPYWNSSGGVIDSFGLFTATEPGDHMVWVYNSDSTLIAEANVYVSSVGTDEIDLIEHPFILYQNRPNPFNNSTVIPFKLKDDGYIRLSIYDVEGRKITDLINGWFSAGDHEISFLNTNFFPGIYYYELQKDNYKMIKKMIITRM